MEVSQTIQERKTIVYETESHIVRFGEEKLNQILDGKDADRILYEQISKKLKSITKVPDHGLLRDEVRDAIFKKITDRNPPYKPTKDKQMKLIAEEEEEEAKVPLNIKAKKEKAEA